MKSFARHAFSARLLVPVLGLLAASGMVLQASNAAYTSTTSNTGNTFAAGTVALVDDDGGSTALLQMSNLVPGSTSTQCIQLDYTGTSFQVTPVKMYAALANEVDNFASVLNIKIEEGTGAVFGNCATFAAGSTLYDGTLSNFASTHGTYATGVNVYTPTSTAHTHAMRFTVTLMATATDAAQGDSVGANFTWEVHSS